MERLASASLQDVLDKVRPAIASGLVNIISVDAIRERSGDRWPKKREQVEAFVERTFARLSQPGDMLVALNEAEFVTVQPNASATTALSISANILKESLAFFLGKAAREDLRLFQVATFVDGALGLRPVLGAALDKALEAEPPAPAARQAQGSGSQFPAVPPCDDLHWETVRRVRLISPPDVELDLAITPEPTWNVGAKVVASFLLRPVTSLASVGRPARVVSASDLSPNMAGEAAIATIAYAAEMIAQRGVRVALHAPVGLNATSYSASRFRLLNALRELPEQVRRFLILEIVEISEGLPQSRLTEVVGMLGPYCRAVLARAPSEAVDVRAWRGFGLSGVTIDCQHLDPADREVQARLGVFARRAAEATLSCVGYSLPSSSLMLAAWASGFTHVGGPLLSAGVRSPDVILRLRPADLFSKPASA
jgi:hypothetical protein